MNANFITAGFVLLTLTLSAQPVSQSIAEDIAIIFQKRNVPKVAPAQGAVAIKSTNSLSFEQERNVVHIVEYTSGGLAIIAGDRSAPPVLGYCEEGGYDTIQMPPGLRYLLNRYAVEIAELRNDTSAEAKIAKEENNRLWDDMLNPSPTPRSTASSVAPLLTTEWHQGMNDFCPNDYPAGCTAVAMAQILNYYNCCIQPQGKHSYSWLFKPIEIDFDTISYNWKNMDNRDENCRLIYHAGISCSMRYNDGWSLSFPEEAVHGFVEHWGIKPEAKVYKRMWNFIGWKKKLKNEINNGRPILYAGVGLNFQGGPNDDVAGGHSWVIDGYDSEDRFHCNWGWGKGWKGWYSLGNFKPQTTEDDTIRHNFNQFERAIFPIEPVQPTGLGATSIITDSTVFHFSPNGYIIQAQPAYGATRYEWSCDQGNIVGDGETATLYCSDNSVTVKMRAVNERCDLYADYVQKEYRIDGGPYISGDYSEEAPAEGEELLQSYSIKQMVAGATGVTWSLSNTTDFEIVSTDYERVVVRSNSYEKKGLLKARIHLHGYDDLFLEANITSNYWDIKGPLIFSCNTDKVSSSVIFPNTESIQWTTSPSIQIVSGANASEAMMTGIANDENAWVQLKVVQEGVTYTIKKHVRVVRPSSLQLEVGGTWVEDSYRKALIHAKTTPVGKHESFNYHWSISGEPSDNPIVIKKWWIWPCVDGGIIVDWSGSGYERVDSNNSQVSSSLPMGEDGEMPLPDVPPAIPENDPSYAVATFPPGEDVTIRCRLTNSCGELTASTFISKYAPASAPSYSVSYNRSTRSVQLDRQDESGAATAQENASYELRLYNNFGLVRTLPFDPTERRISLPLGDLPDGSYYVNVVDSQGEVLCKQYISAY